MSPEPLVGKSSPPPGEILAPRVEEFDQVDRPDIPQPIGAGEFSERDHAIITIKLPLPTCNIQAIARFLNWLPDTFRSSPV